ncbi:MAG: undecaprenyl-diphosphate phosphatase, partial [Epulopiscium sp.]|nr:undecaprenyl-diphosphate phosphatase [Candidatus Epulonipiscium sp.]
MEIIELIKAMILGIIEGITEWLPVSSTGHMILADEFIKLNMSASFKEMFFVVVQLGAIMAVVVLYFHKLNPFSLKKNSIEKQETFSLWFKVAVACLPAAIIGLLFDDKIDELFYNYQTVTFTLILYGILFIVVENWNTNKEPKIKELSGLTYQAAFLIGIFQLLALIPGTSRSGATILGAILIGTSRYVAAEFTFFLAIPVMFGASLLKIIKFGILFTGAEIGILLTGMIVAFVVSILSIKFLLGYIKKHDFKVFGYYRILLGVIV